MELNHYVRQVRAGHEIEVTDHGRVVAELRPTRRVTSGRNGLDDLVRQGLLSLGAPNAPALYPRMPRRLKRGELQRLMDKERGAR